jgi:putative phage-type endonuclease
MSFTEEQQRIRRTGITGTDICALMAPVLGIPSFRTPFQVFAEKMGKADPVEVTEDMERGTFLEDGARQWYAHRTGALKVEQPGTVVSRRNPLVIATPDGVAHHRDSVRALEIKMPGSVAGWGEAETDAVPPWYLPQVLWELAALDLERADVFAVLDGKPRLYHVARDVELEGLLVEHAERFWRDHVVTGKPPEVTAADLPAVSRYHRKHETSEHLDFSAMPPEQQAALEEYLRAYAEQDAATQRLAVWEARAKLLVGTAPGVKNLPEELGVSRIDWRQNKPGSATNWKGVLEALGSEDPVVAARMRTLIQQHTTATEGKRPFTPRALTKRGAR